MLHSDDMLTVRVARWRDETAGIRSFELEAPDRAALPAFEAGAHIDVHLDAGLVRQYSLCNPPSERHRYRIAVQREPASRGGSVAMHALVATGALLRIGRPRNHFALTPGPAALLLAGGIGITPLLAMAHALHARGQAFALHYSGRAAGTMAFVPELCAAAFAPQVSVYRDDDPAGRFDAARVLAGQGADTQLYVCGPRGFMDHVFAVAQAQGWAADRLHREYFAGPALALDAEAGFELRLARSGLRCSVPPHRTLVQVLAAHGVPVPTLCGSGVCGTCLTGVLDGIPDHRDSFLSAQERAANDRLTPCCSRALSPVLVLDL